MLKVGTKNSKNVCHSPLRVSCFALSVRLTDEQCVQRALFGLDEKGLGWHFQQTHTHQAGAHTHTHHAGVVLAGSVSLWQCYLVRAQEQGSDGCVV